MSGVVLRCPNCGTTRSAPGECDACHESAVRYFCTNHSPGRWLESSACGQCGARFGEAGRRMPPGGPRPGGPAAPPGASGGPQPAAGRPAATPRPPSAEPTRRPAPTGPSEPGGRGTGGIAPPRPREAPRPAVPDDDPLRIFRGGPAGGVPTGSPEPPWVEPPPTWIEPEPPAARRRGPGLGGCLLRLVLFVFVLLFGLVSSLFLFGGSLLRVFGPY